MLARENRLSTAADFQAAIKTGRKASTEHLVVYLKRVDANAPARFGFLVSKLIGNAVKRNLVKRRLRELSRTHLANHENELVVVRALPGTAELDFEQLKVELDRALQKLETR